MENLNQDAIIILLGDFNIDLASNHFYSIKLNDLIAKHGIYQLIDKYTRVTRISSTKIDLLLTNQKNINYEVLTTPKITDHSIITVDLKSKYIEKRKEKSYRNYKSMDVMGFQLKLMDMAWPQSQNTNKLAECLIDNLLCALNQFAPERTVVYTEKFGDKKWWNEEISNEIRLRDHLYQRAIVTKADEDWNNYRQQRNKVVSMIRNTKTNYFNDKIDLLKDDPTEMWKTIRKLINSKTNEGPKPEIIFDNKRITGKEISEQFNIFFLDSIKEIVKNNNQNEIVSNIEVKCVMEKFKILEMTDLRKIVKKMKNKGSNTDGITVQILKYGFEAIGDKFLKIINSSLEKGIFPSSWKNSMVIPVEKVKDTIKCEEFRPINMVPPYEKLLKYVLMIK
ncbi:uncharacterized protein LOC130451424 [Diorhabda sublineata]|uniref:uncharacterized protein LOC130451424 n=1 Tax=Diorhabda sublineata TaxID=1163346 RepID=UPI0024E075EF|nr:uncharacterized protein LOC130451424 [Diorhabda sublineata]